MTATDPAAMLHQLTQHGSPTDRSLLVDFQPLDPSNRPAPFKRYLDLETRAFPTELGEAAGPRPALDAHRGSRARLLFFTAGVTRSSSTPAFEERTYFRTAMSAGNLHPVEVYAVCSGVDGVADGVHHFAPLEFGLTTSRGSRRAGTGRACSCSPGIPWRTAWKYGERGFRHLYWDAGTMLANLLAMASADCIDAKLWTGFVDDDVARLVGIDGVTEFPLALVSIGVREAPVVPARPAAARPRRRAHLAAPDHFPARRGTRSVPATSADAGAVDEWRTHAIEGNRRAERSNHRPGRSSSRSKK